MTSTEFTKKLRAAIKSKIQELGIEVDDELPDYIMVMIANKKDKTKMKNDLMLFLSDNTDIFVDWLFDFFDKVNKKETEEGKPKEPEKPLKREKKYENEDREKRTRSRSPRNSRSRSPRRSKREEEKPRREPIRAPSPNKNFRRERRRSRSVEDDRRKKREERKKITYSDSDDDNRKVKSAAVVPNKLDRNISPPRVSSQVVVKKRKADPETEKAATNIFKRAVTDFLKDDELPKRKTRRIEPSDDVLQVNTSKSTKRTILVENDDGSDEISDEPSETQFIVKMNKATALRKKTLKAIRAMKEAENQLGDENVILTKCKKRADDPIRAFLKLSGVKAKSNPNETEVEALVRTKMLLAKAVAGQSGSIWDGKISVEDEDLSESDNEEAEIDAFLADSLVPPTVSLSRPILPAPQRKVEVGKIPERCKFYPNCRNEAACVYSHPSKPCINFPNCWFGDKCLFIHPKCKFEPNCSKAGCPYMHTMPRVMQQPPIKPKLSNILSITNPQTNGSEINEFGGSESASKESIVIENGKEIETHENNSGKEETKQYEPTKGEENGQGSENEENKTENTEKNEKPEEPKPDVPLQTGPLTTATTVPKIKPIVTTTSTVQCRFGNRCHNETCSYRHPKKCRYDEACTNESCFFWHPKKNAGRFRWTKT